MPTKAVARAASNNTSDRTPRLTAARMAAGVGVRRASAKAGMTRQAKSAATARAGQTCRPVLIAAKDRAAIEAATSTSENAADGVPAARDLPPAEQGHARDVGRGNQAKRPIDRQGARYGRHPQAEIQSPAGTHVEGAQDGVLLAPAVVEEHRRSDGEGRSARLIRAERCRQDTSGQKARPKRGRMAGCNPPTRQRAFGSFDRVHVPVEHVVQDHAAGVETGRRDEQPGQSAGVAESSHGKARQHVSEGRRDVRRPDQLQVGTEHV